MFVFARNTNYVDLSSLHAGTFLTTSDSVVMIQWEKYIQFHSFPFLHLRYFKTAHSFADKMLATTPFAVRGTNKKHHCAR